MSCSTRQKPKTAIAVWQPATRLACVHVHGEGDGWDVLPVLAIEASETHFPDEDAAEIRHRPLVFFDGSIMTADDVGRFYDGATEVVETTWPAAEDRERLADVAARLRRMLAQRDARKAEQAAKDRGAVAKAK